MRKLALVAVLVAAVAVAGPAFASDIYPPYWRGKLGSQTVDWEFLTSGNYAGNPLSATYVPDCSIQYGWTPAFQPSLLHIPGPGVSWSLTQPTGTTPGWVATPPADCGWIGLSGDVYINLPDTSASLPHKEIWLQLTWEPQAETNVPIVQYGINGENSTYTASVLADHILWDGDGAAPGRSVHLTEYHIDISPNPQSEGIHISGGINVDEIVVDTICYTTVPEPATLTLLGLGVAPVVWRRFRMAKK